MIIYFVELPRCYIDTRLWYALYQCYSYSFQQLIAHNKGRKHQLRLAELELKSSHDDSKYLKEHLKRTFYVSEFYLDTLPIPYEKPMLDFSLIDEFRKKDFSILLCVRKVLKVEIKSRFTKSDKSDYNYGEGAKELLQIHHNVVLIEDECILGIIIFDDIPSKECDQIEIVNRGLFDSSGKVNRGHLKKVGE